MLFAYQKKHKVFDFHVILRFLRTIYSCFRDSGIFELLVEGGNGTEGTFPSAIWGRGIKQGMCYYKILHEAFARSEIKFLKNLTWEKTCGARYNLW